MIIDVHSPTPRHSTSPEAENAALSAMWRPDQPRSTVHTWDDDFETLAQIIHRASLARLGFK